MHMKEGLLFVAILLVAELPVNKQSSEVTNVEVRDGCFETRWQRPSQGHQQVTTVLPMSTILSVV